MTQLNFLFAFSASNSKFHHFYWLYSHKCIRLEKKKYKSMNKYTYLQYFLLIHDKSPPPPPSSPLHPALQNAICCSSHEISYKICSTEHRRANKSQTITFSFLIHTIIIVHKFATCACLLAPHRNCAVFRIYWTSNKFPSSFCCFYWYSYEMMKDGRERRKKIKNKIKEFHFYDIFLLLSFFSFLPPFDCASKANQYK